MAQLEIEKLSGQLQDATAQLALLESISSDQMSRSVQLGSLAVTSQGDFYVAAGIGQVEVDGRKYFAISAHSPLGKKLSGVTVGQSFVLNGKTFNLLEII